MNVFQILVKTVVIVSMESIPTNAAALLVGKERIVKLVNILIFFYFKFDGISSKSKTDSYHL